MALSPATIRNVMADLEESGLLFAPHTSAGRMPTDAGLRLFVDGLLEVGSLTDDERKSIDAQCAGSGAGLEELLEDATAALSGISRYAGLVLAPKTDSPLKHIELVNLSPGRALVILVTESGVVENRVIETPHGVAPSSLVEASNYLSARLVGRTLSEGYDVITAEDGEAALRGIAVFREGAHLLEGSSLPRDQPARRWAIGARPGAMRCRRT